MSPTSAEIHAELARQAQRRPEQVRLSIIGTTAADRPIEAAEITDFSEAPDDKQHVLIVAGQHGNEETARLVALRLIDHLLLPANAALLKRQRFVILPNVSPDAAEADSYETPAGIKPNLDFGPESVSPEARAVRAIADALQPEIYVDIHARGHSGWSHDMVLFPPTRPYTEDEHLLHNIATSMAAEGEKSGIPHVVHPLTWPGWGGTDPDQPSSTLYMYRQFKSLVFLTESAESHDDPLGGSHPLEQQMCSGIGRLKPLIALGNSKPAAQFYAGYPATPVIGMYHAGIVAVGVTAAARRANRVELWQNSEGFENVSAVVPEKPGVKRIRVKYTGPAILTGAGIQTRAAGVRRVLSVTINGRQIQPHLTAGYYSWHDAYTTFAVVALPQFPQGEYEIAFHFDAPDGR